MFVFWFMLAVLGFVTVFGVGTTLNMVFRVWWLSTLLYVLFSIYLIIALGSRLLWQEWVLYVIGLVAAVLAAWACKAMKNRGYALFAPQQ